MKNRIPGILGVAAIALAATTAFPQERGVCFSAEVPAPIAMPDGGVHEAGTLTVCLSRRLSPVTMIHSVAVNGSPLGFYVSRTGKAEGSSFPHPVIAFVRDRSGALELAGYAWPSGSHMRTFRFGPVTPSFAVRNSAVPLEETTADDAAPVWLVARLD